MRSILFIKIHRETAASMIGLGLLVLQFIPLIGAVDKSSEPSGFHSENFLVPTRFKRLVVSQGQFAEPDDYPWMAMLIYTKFKIINGIMKIDHFRTGCAANLLNDRYVLTAAHCITDIPQDLSMTAVSFGVHDKRVLYGYGQRKNDEYGIQRDIVHIAVRDIIVHAGYTNSAKRNDIALVRLARKVHYTDYIKPILLPTSSDIPRDLYISGWGVTENGKLSAIKRKLKISWVDWHTCSNLYMNSSIKLGAGQICAGGSNKMGVCSGDSGGPLMAPKRNFNYEEKWTLYGIISLGSENGNYCGVEGWPDVYTDVYYYVPWIMSKMHHYDN